MKITRILLPLFSLLLAHTGQTGGHLSMSTVMGTDAKERLMQLMESIKVTKQDLNAQAERTYKQQLSRDIAAIDVHKTDANCNRVCRQLFESNEMLLHFIDQTTIDKIQKVEQANAVETLKNLYRRFFALEKISVFAEKNLRPLLSKKESKPYHIYAIQDTLNDLEHYNKKLISFNKLKSGFDKDYQQNWERLLDTFEIDCMKWTGPNPNAYVDFVKVMLFFEGFAHANKDLIAENPKLFEDLFECHFFHEIFPERAKQNFWLCGPGYMDRAMLHLIKFLPQKVYCSFGMEQDEIQRILTDDEIESHFPQPAPQNTLFGELEKVTSKDLETALEKLTKLQVQINQMTSRETKLQVQSNQIALIAKESKVEIRNLLQFYVKNNINTMLENSCLMLEKALQKKRSTQEIEALFANAAEGIVRDALHLTNEILESPEIQNGLTAQPEKKDDVAKDIIARMKKNNLLRTVTVKHWEDLEIFLKQLEVVAIKKFPRLKSLNPVVQNKQQVSAQPMNRVVQSKQAESPKSVIATDHEKRAKVAQSIIEMTKKRAKEIAQLEMYPMIKDEVKKLEQKIKDCANLQTFWIDTGNSWAKSGTGEHTAATLLKFFELNPRFCAENKMANAYQSILKQGKSDMSALDILGNAIENTSQRMADLLQLQEILATFSPKNKELFYTQLIRHLVITGTNTKSKIAWNSQDLEIKIIELQFPTLLDNTQAQKEYESILNLALGETGQFLNILRKETDASQSKK